MRPLLLSEVFGPTFQGEGPSAGRRAAFVRLGLCNLDCSWCDTPYTWDWTGKIGPKQDRDALVHATTDDVADMVTARDVDLVVITGGEPMIQQTALAPLVQRLVDSGHEVEVETNGTLMPHEPILRAHVRWNVSPKLSGSGVDPDRALHIDALSEYVALGAALKFVVTDLAELDEIEQLVGKLGAERRSVWVMPEGRRAVDVLDRMALLDDEVLARGWNLTPRLHVLLWGDERGR